MGRPFSIQDEDVIVQVLLPDGVDHELTLKQHLITQARLASRIQSHPDEPSIMHYHNIDFWRETPAPLRQMAEKHRHIPEALDHLSCRMLMQLTRYLDPRMAPAHSSPSYQKPPSGLPPEIELDIMNSCKRFIDVCYDGSADAVGFQSSFLYSTDVFCASVAYVALAQRRQIVTGQMWTIDANEMLQKGLLLMTIGGGSKFSASRVFHKALLTISASLVRSGPSSNSTVSIYNSGLFCYTKLTLD